MTTRYLLQHLVRDAAERAPLAPAVRHGDDELTYGELESASNAFAHALVASGVERGDRVVLHLPKSVNAVVALYGILKAGAAYVPVEHGSPPPRLEDIIGQCRPSAIVTWSEARSKLSVEHCRSAGVSCIASVDSVDPFTDLPVRTLSLPHAVATGATHSLGRPCVDQDLAYILFTSGSTGTPKGVMLSHLNALTFVNWAVETFSFRAEDRFSNHAPFNFDLSVLDLFGAAAAGGCVTLVPEGLGMFPSRLADLIERERLTVWYSVPSILTLLVTRGNLAARDLGSVRWVLFAGEVFPVKYLRQVMAALPRARYANLYGPTETNVITWYEVEALESDRTEPIPIGKACANTDCLAIQEGGDPVTRPGQEGLLHARGSTVMRGYFGRPAETEAAFVPSPYAAGGADKLYATGDWVTIDSHGDYLFLGRRDHMVKTGGYRVELGEIETALLAHPAVREAAAVPVPDDVLGNRIRVCVVADGLSEQEVKAHCASLLPRYMVPEGVDLRDALPRTANDKIDRQRLVTELLDATSARSEPVDGGQG